MIVYEEQLEHSNIQIFPVFDDHAVINITVLIYYTIKILF